MQEKPMVISVVQLKDGKSDVGGLVERMGNDEREDEE